MNDGANFLQFNGTVAIVAGLILLVIAPPVGGIVLVVGVLVAAFGGASAPAERAVMSQASSNPVGAGCGLFVLAVAGIAFFGLLALGALGAMGGM